MNISHHEISSGKILLPEFVSRVAEIWASFCRAMAQEESNYITTGKLTAPQFWALQWLHRHGSCPMHELVEALKTKSSTATVLMDRLSQLKLVSRNRDKKDRRVVHVALTAKGKRILDDIHKQRTKGIADLFRPLNAQERGLYLTLIEKLHRELSLKGQNKS